MIWRNRIRIAREHQALSDRALRVHVRIGVRAAPEAMRAESGGLGGGFVR